MNICDNYDLWLAHERRQQRWLDSLPHCEHCNEPIQDESLYRIDGSLFCPDCTETHYPECYTDEYKESTDNYIER